MAGPASVFSAENRVLFAGFFITLAFSYTQIPWVERLTCQCASRVNRTTAYST